MIKLPEPFRSDWIAALRSGDRFRGHNALRSGAGLTYFLGKLDAELVDPNDNKKLNFSEIADWLEQNTISAANLGH